MRGGTLHEGDHVVVTVNGEEVGPGRIVEAAAGVRVFVVVERPRGGPYRFGAPRTWFEAAGPGQWRLHMPSPTRGEFILPEE
jgi:hypothetical protein